MSAYPTSGPVRFEVIDGPDIPEDAFNVVIHPRIDHIEFDTATGEAVIALRIGGASWQTPAAKR